MNALLPPDLNMRPKGNEDNFFPQKHMNEKSVISLKREL
jgi:hypothetical protein